MRGTTVGYCDRGLTPTAHTNVAILAPVLTFFVSFCEYC